MEVKADQIKNSASNATLARFMSFSPPSQFKCLTKYKVDILEAAIELIDEDDVPRCRQQVERLLRIRKNELLRVGPIYSYVLRQDTTQPIRKRSKTETNQKEEGNKIWSWLKTNILPNSFPLSHSNQNTETTEEQFPLCDSNLIKTSKGNRKLD